MFVAGESVYSAMAFSFFSFCVAVPSAIKVFNWTATMYKGSVSWDTPMLYAIGFIGLFTIGGMTGLMVAVLGTRRSPARHLLRDCPLPLHHGGRNGNGISGRRALLVAKGKWKNVSRRPCEVSAVVVFIGFNLTFFPQLVLGYLGMPRRYSAYPEEFQMLHVLSTAGATILGVGLCYAALLLDMGLVLRQRCRAKPMASHRPRVENLFTSADA